MISDTSRQVFKYIREIFIEITDCHTQKDLRCINHDIFVLAQPENMAKVRTSEKERPVWYLNFN